MEFKTEIAKASCKGIKPIGMPNQDFILVRDAVEDPLVPPTQDARID